MHQLITPEEAAEMLNISTRTLYKLAREGILRMEFPEGKSFQATRRFRQAEVAALIEVKSKKLDLPTVAALARQAHISSRQTENVLEYLLRFIGVDIPLLSLKETDVLSLYLRIEDAIEFEGQRPAHEIRKWARIFQAMGEEYLERIEDIVEDLEPWYKPLELARLLCKHAPRDQFPQDRELHMAYGFLDVARRNLRRVAYFYIRAKHGYKTATKLFPASKGDPFERIIALSFHE